MNKRELRKLPAPKVTKEVKTLAKKLKKQDERVISVFRTEVEGKDTLVLDVFSTKAEPYVRAFFQDDDYITLDFEKNSWKLGALDSILGYKYVYKRKIVYAASKNDKKLLDDWIGEYCSVHNVQTHYVNNEPECIIDKYQEDIKHRRLIIKAQKKRDYIDSRMSYFKEPSKEEFLKWMDETAMYNHNFIFYDRKNKNAYCTRCKNEYDLQKDGSLKMKKAGWVTYGPQGIKHNKPAVCPFCMSKDLGVKTTAKSIGYSRNQMVEVQWVNIIDTTEIDGKSAVLLRYVCCLKDYRKDFYNPELGFYELFRTIHFEDHYEDYEWGWDIHFHRDNWIVFRQKPWYWNPSKFSAPNGGVIPYNITNENLKDSWLKYSCTEEIAEIWNNYSKESRKTESNWFYDDYFNFYRKHRSIEKFIKIGWTKLACEMLEGPGGYYAHRDNIKDLIDENARTAAEAVGITREQFQMLKSIKDNPRWKDIKILRYCNQQNKRVNRDELAILIYLHEDGYADNYQNYINWKDYTTIYKLRKYCSNLPKNANEHDYFEYLEWTRALGYDLKNSFNLFPKNFIETHDYRSKEYLKAQNRLQREAAKEFNRLLRKYRCDTKDVEALNMNVDGLFIRLPDGLKELTKEGEALHHCVGTYKEKVMKGETTILFIRKISEPTKSYYTLEWQNGRVVQCRGMKNCAMTPQVKAFVELFKEKMVEYENAQLKTRRAG